VLLQVPTQTFSLCSAFLLPPCPHLLPLVDVAAPRQHGGRGEGSVVSPPLSAARPRLSSPPPRLLLPTPPLPATSRALSSSAPAVLRHVLRRVVHVLHGQQYHCVRVRSSLRSLPLFTLRVPPLRLLLPHLRPPLQRPRRRPLRPLRPPRPLPPSSAAVVFVLCRPTATTGSVCGDVIQCGCLTSSRFWRESFVTDATDDARGDDEEGEDEDEEEDRHANDGRWARSRTGARRSLSAS